MSASITESGRYFACIDTGKTYSVVELAENLLALMAYSLQKPDVIDFIDGTLTWLKGIDPQADIVWKKEGNKQVPTIVKKYDLPAPKGKAPLKPQ